MSIPWSAVISMRRLMRQIPLTRRVFLASLCAILIVDLTAFISLTCCGTLWWANYALPVQRLLIPYVPVMRQSGVAWNNTAIFGDSFNLVLTTNMVVHVVALVFLSFSVVREFLTRATAISEDIASYVEKSGKNLAWCAAGPFLGWLLIQLFATNEIGLTTNQIGYIYHHHPAAAYYCIDLGIFFGCSIGTFAQSLICFAAWLTNWKGRRARVLAE